MENVRNFTDFIHKLTPFLQFNTVSSGSMSPETVSWPYKPEPIGTGPDMDQNMKKISDQFGPSGPCVPDFDFSR